MEVKNTIKNSLKDNFSQIPNKSITDSRISSGAFRVLTYMFSKPSNWEFNNSDVQYNMKIKRRETMSKYWKELIDSGWVSREAKSNNRGFIYTLNFMCEGDVLKERVRKIRTRKIRTRKNSTLNNTEYISNTDIISNTESNVLSDKPDLEFSENKISELKENKKNAPPKVAQKYPQEISEIIGFLNELLDTKYKTKTKATVSALNARLSEGFTVEEIKKVIELKVMQWKDNAKMFSYLRPNTLFGSKLEGYVNECVRLEKNPHLQENFKNSINGTTTTKSKHQITAEELEDIRRRDEIRNAELAKQGHI